MPIPPLDADGNLAAGPVVSSGSGGPVHNTAVVARMAEIHARFVQGKPLVGSPTRAEIWDGWQRHRRDLAALGVPFVTMVNGSFLSAKPDPGDVDLVIVFDGPGADKLTTKNRKLFKKLLCGGPVKTTHQCHAFGVPLYRFGERGFTAGLRQMAYFTRLFGHDKVTTREKSFPYGDGGGDMIDRRRSAQDFEHDIGAIDELLDDEAQLAGDVPFGLQVAFEGLRNERDALAALRDQLADEGMAAHDLIVVLTGKPVVGHTVDTRFLASVLGKLQDVVQAFTSAMAGRPTAGGPYTAPLKRMSTLRVAGSFASSFGVALETADVQQEMELHGSAPLADAFNALIELINSGEDPELLLTGLGSLGQRARSHYKQLLERVASKGGDIEITWASVKGPQRASISAEKARSAAGVLDRVTEATHYEETTGLLTGGNTRLGTFELVDDRDRLLTGRLSREIKEELKLNNRIRANLHVTELTYAGLDHPKRHYRLDEIAYLGQAGE